MGGPAQAKVNSPIDQTGAPQLPGEVPRSILDMFGQNGISGQAQPPAGTPPAGGAGMTGIPFNYQTRGMNFNQMRVQEEIAKANAAKTAPVAPAQPVATSPKPQQFPQAGPRPFEFNGMNPGGGARFAPAAGLSSQNQLAGASSSPK